MAQVVIDIEEYDRLRRLDESVKGRSLFVEYKYGFKDPGKGLFKDGIIVIGYDDITRQHLIDFNTQISDLEEERAKLSFELHQLKAKKTETKPWYKKIL